MHNSLSRSEIRNLERTSRKVDLSKAAETALRPRLEEVAKREQLRSVAIAAERQFLPCLNGESSILTKRKIRVKMTLSPIRSPSGQPDRDGRMLFARRVVTRADCHERDCN